MTDIYFVRHAQSKTGWNGSDKDKPLTEVGLNDSNLVKVALKNVKFDYCVCSSYKRSIETIKECAIDHKLVINTDDRFGERISGKNSNEKELIKRWNDFNYHEEGGESIGSCQKRNIEALNEILLTHENETILFGTHGTALCTILNFYDSSVDINYFYEIFNWLPYIIHVVFDKTKFIKSEKVLILNRGY